MPSHRGASLVQIQTETIVHSTEDGYGMSTTCLHTSYWSGYRPIFFFDFIYIPEHVSTTKTGRPWPLHNCKGLFVYRACAISPDPRSLIKGDCLGLA